MATSSVYDKRTFPASVHPLGQGMGRACVHVLPVTTEEEAPQQAPGRPLQTTGYRTLETCVNAAFVHGSTEAEAAPNVQFFT